VDRQGRVLVTDIGAGKVNIHRFDGDVFEFIASYSGFGLPNGIAVDRKDNIYVDDTSHNRIVVLDQAGNHLIDLTYPNDGYSGILFKPYSVAVDSKGTIIEAGSGNHRVITIQDISLSMRVFMPVVKR